MTGEKARSLCSLKKILVEMFDETNSENPEDSYQGLLILLEKSLSLSKYISTNHINLKSTCVKHTAELEWKTEECNKLKAEVIRLETAKCNNCSTLETELLSYKKKFTEAENRIKSIANILKLSDSIEESDGQRKNSAMALVSQMLLAESPKRKKRNLSKISSPLVKKNINDYYGGVIPESIPVFTDYSIPVKSLENDIDSPGGKMDIVTSPGDNVDIITSPGEKIDTVNSPGDRFNFLKDRTSRSINLPITSARRSQRNIRKNLTTEFVDSKQPEESPMKNLKFNKQGLDQLSLNGSLVDYVREGNSELDKIWFSDSINSKRKNSKKIDSNDKATNKTKPKLPEKICWKMKEVRGPSEISGSSKLRQMKLNLGVKNKEVDLCSLDGYDGGSSSIIVDMKMESTSRKVRYDNLPCGEVDTPCSSEDFKPKSTSTQILIHDREKNSSKSGNPQYKYKRETVRKKAERIKMDGWDCEKCAEYYGAVGLSPSKIKARMNKCSRHRDNFDQLNNTPADYWNPIFPDSEECREKRLYVSIYPSKGDES